MGHGATSAIPDVLLVFPPELTARQRAALHELGEAHGLVHASQGDGAARHVRLGKSSGKQVDVSKVAGKSILTDTDIVKILESQLKLSDVSSVFAHPAPPGAGFSFLPAGSKSLARPPDLDAWVKRMLECVELERQAEVQQATEAATMCTPETAQARGRALLNLRVNELEGGLLGRTLLTLVSNKGWTGVGAAPELPPHKFGGHDVVALRPNRGPSEGPPLCTGVIYRVRDNAVVVACDDVPDEGMDMPLRLEKLANEVTYKRLKTTLGSLSHVAAGVSVAGAAPLPGAHLASLAFGTSTPRFVDKVPEWTPVNARLDGSQQAAVSRALAAQDVALIHGPPGTGKTTAVVEYVCQELARGSRVLVVAASNIAVDNLVERLVPTVPKGVKVLRVGHPARLLPQILDSCLEAHVLKSDNSALAKDCRKEIKRLNQQLMKLGPRDRAERRTIRGDLKRLAGEERSRQAAAIQEVIKGARVIASTLTGLLHHSLEGQVFDVTVIDEAAQALEPACWAALLRAPRAVLAGDHLQLPPTVLSEDAAARGLGTTLFERLHALHHAHGISTLLTVQYRMHTQIMTWSSDALYQGQVTAHESVAGHTVHDLVAASSPGGGVATGSAATPGAVGGKAGAKERGGKKTTRGATAATGAAGAAPAVDAAAAAALPVLLLLDTAGCGFEEQKEEEGDSKRNEGEAKAVMAHVQRLLRAGLKPSDVGVITPYNAQVALLREMRPERLQGLEISSVDGFQGREKEAIVISMVRSNPMGEVGFLSDQRRMNVAVTRARRHVALVADTDTVSKDPFLAGLIRHFESHGEYCSAQELVNESEVQA